MKTSIIFILSITILSLLSTLVYADEDQDNPYINLSEVVNVIDAPGHVDSDPLGKTIRKIYVKTLPPFPIYTKDKFTRFVFNVGNAIVFKSREWIVRSELLFDEGDDYDQTVIDETLRLLKGIYAITEANIYTIQTDDPDRIDIIVVTVDLFPYQFNVDFKNTGAQWFFKVAGIWRNVLGLHNETEFRFERQPYKIKTLYTYRDPFFLNSKIEIRQFGQLHWRARPLYPTNNYDEYEFNGYTKDGYRIGFAVEQLRHTLYDEFEFHIESLFEKGTTKVYEGEIPKSIYFDEFGEYIPDEIIDTLLEKEQPIPDIWERIPAIGCAYNQFYLKMGVNYAFKLSGIHWKLIPGVFYNIIDHSLDFLDEVKNYETTQSPEMVEIRNQNYREEVFSALEETLIGISLEQGYYDYYKLQNIYKFGRDEYIQKGYGVKLSFGVHHPVFDPFWIHNQHDPYYFFEADLNYSVFLAEHILLMGEHLLTSRLTVNSVFYESQFTNQLKVFVLDLGPGYLATQSIFQMGKKTQPSTPYTVGGEQGLRAFDANYRLGDHRLGFQVEYRSDPIPLIKWLNIGIVGFYETAAIWIQENQSLADTTWLHDLGVGLRFFFPSINPNMGSFDFAFSPVNRDSDGKLHWNIFFQFGHIF